MILFARGQFGVGLPVAMFIWQPVDSYFRLVTARRNPNLLLLSGFAFAGLPKQGLVAVACWTVSLTVCLSTSAAVQRLMQWGQVPPLHSAYVLWERP